LAGRQQAQSTKLRGSVRQSLNKDKIKTKRLIGVECLKMLNVAFRPS
jgi:hypothetical protein